MIDTSEQILNAVSEIRDLVRLLAEPQIAARDQELRDELRSIVGRSVPKQRSVSLMDGAHSQSDIRAITSINQGNLSTLVKELNEGQLLVGDVRLPKLAISIPLNFFDIDAKAE